MGNQSDVVMSGVVDSGRERGHGNIDANDPEQSLRKDVEFFTCKIA